MYFEATLSTMYYLIIALHLLYAPVRDSIPFPYAIKQPSKPFKWENIELNLSQRYKDSVVRTFKRIYASQLNPAYLESSKFTSSLHFVSLNGDNLPDVIYKGWSGGEGAFVDFFINEKKKFRKAFSTYQELLELQYTAGKVSSFVVYDPGCCDPTVEFERQYSVDSLFHCKLTRQRGIIVGSSIRESGYTYPDGFFDQPIRFKTINPNYALRYAPEISMKVPTYVDFDSRDSSRGNIMAEYPSGFQGVAWAYKKDATGREWWLVEMEPAFHLEFNRFWDLDDEYTHYYGWMSSRFVERLP
jgi:hypothetical protein